MPNKFTPKEGIGYLKGFWRTLNRICVFCLKPVPFSRKYALFCSDAHQKEYKYLKGKDIREKRKANDRIK